MFKFLSILTLLLFSHQALAENSVRLMTEDFAPYQYFEGEGEKKKIAGISIEIVRAIQTRIGNNDPIKVLPWSRGLKLLAKHKNAALFSTARTPSRENKFRWVGPLSKLEMVFFKKVGNDLKITSMEDAKKIGKVGVTKNVATHEILVNQGFTNLDVLQSGADEKNITRLIKGRIDVWPTSYFAGIYSFKKRGLLDQVEVIPNVTILSGNLYIAFNKNTDDQIIRRWQNALDQLNKNDVIKNILKKYDR